MQIVTNAVMDCACKVWSPPVSQEEYTAQRLYYFLKPEGLIRLIFIMVCILIMFLCIPLYEQGSMIGFLAYTQLLCFFMAAYCIVSILLRVIGYFLYNLFYFKADLVTQIVFVAFNCVNLICWIIFSVKLSILHDELIASGVAPTGSRSDEISLTNLCFTTGLILGSIYFGALDLYVIIRKPLAQFDFDRNLRHS